MLTGYEETHFRLNKCDQNPFKTISKWSSLKSRMLMPGVMGVNMTQDSYFGFKMIRKTVLQCLHCSHTWIGKTETESKDCISQEEILFKAGAHSTDLRISIRIEA